MKKNSNIKILIFVLLASAMMVSSGCVSMIILSAGKSQGEVFGSNSKPASRASVENQIGLPFETRQLAELPWADDFRELKRKFYDINRINKFVAADVYYDRLRKIHEGRACDKNTNDASIEGTQTAHEPRKFVYARYYYKGRIISAWREYNYSILAFGSWGLLEPVMIPVAVLTLATSQHNYIDVWYDDYGFIVAYTWALAPYEAPPFVAVPKQAK